MRREHSRKYVRQIILDGRVNKFKPNTFKDDGKRIPEDGDSEITSRSYESCCIEEQVQRESKRDMNTSQEGAAFIEERAEMESESDMNSSQESGTLEERGGSVKAT